MMKLETIAEARMMLTEENLDQVLRAPELGLPPQYLAAMAAEILELRSEARGLRASCETLEAQAAGNYSHDIERIADALERLAGCVYLKNGQSIINTANWIDRTF